MAFLGSPSITALCVSSGGVKVIFFLGSPMERTTRSLSELFLFPTMMRLSVTSIRK